MPWLPSNVFSRPYAFLCSYSRNKTKACLKALQIKWQYWTTLFRKSVGSPWVIESQFFVSSLSAMITDGSLSELACLLAAFSQPSDLVFERRWSKATVTLSLTVTKNWQGGSVPPPTSKNLTQVHSGIGEVQSPCRFGWRTATQG